MNRTIAMVMACAAAAAGQERARTAYDVSALTETVENFTGPWIGFPGEAPEPLFEEEENRWISPEDLVEGIRRNIDPDSWEDDRNSIESNEGLLFVTQTKENHELIAKYLAALRSQVFRTVVVEADVVQLAPGAIDAKAGALLSADQAKAVDAALADPASGRLVASLRAVGNNRQRVFATAVGDRDHLSDWDIEIANDSVIGDPIVGRVRDGAVLEVRPFVALDGASVLLEVRFQLADAGNMTTFDAGSKQFGLLELPQTTALQARTQLMLPPGRTAVLAAAHGARGVRAGWQTWVLLRASVQAEKAEEIPAGDTRVLRAYDVAAVTRRPGSWPGPDLGRLDLVGEPLVTVFEAEESADPGLSIDPESVVELVQANVAPESWRNAKNRLWFSAGQLLAVNTPEVQKSVADYLSGLAASRSRMVSVEAWLFSLDEKSWASRRAALSGAEAADADWTALLADAAKDEGVRLVGSMRTVGQNGTRFHAARGAVRSLVADYDVEIAEGSFAWDPIVLSLADGFSLDVTPVPVGDGGQIMLDLRPQIVVATDPAPGPAKAGAVSLQQVSLADYGMKTQTLVAAGRPVLVGTTVKSEGGTREVALLFVKAEIVK